MNIRLRDNRRDEALKVCLETFHDYPAMRFMLGGNGDFPSRLALLIGSWIDSRLIRSVPVLGIEQDEELAAIALVDEPAQPIMPEEFERENESLRSTLGEETWHRIAAFEQALADLEPKEPHHYIGLMGVRDHYQGRGLARQLIEEVARLSRQDPDSQSICLSTESPDNLPFYTHLGFTILGEVQIGSLRSWTLQKMTSAR